MNIASQAVMIAPDVHSQPLGLTKEEILADYRLGHESRQASLLGRKEVFMGKAKFGIFGDGKELAQLAMARSFKPGDFRSGYYRDQTFMAAIGQMTWQQYFAQLYAHADSEADPASGGRMMNGHFGTRLLDKRGLWKKQTEMKNSTSDISPTASQMPRLLGLAYASKLYRHNMSLHDMRRFSIYGNEIAFGTIGNASTSEGMFYEAINAGGVLQVPMLVSVWDDEYGISVPKEYHTTKYSISEALAGFQRTAEKAGYEIFVVKGHDYQSLMKTYAMAANICRTEHCPILIHVVEMTQPQGHSTSGSHERYKPAERLVWEQEYDCLKQMRQWILTHGLAGESELDAIEKEAVETVKQARLAAWDAFINPIIAAKKELCELLAVASFSYHDVASLVDALKSGLESNSTPIWADLHKAARAALRLLRQNQGNAKEAIQGWVEVYEERAAKSFNSHLSSESEDAVLEIRSTALEFDDASPMVDGREVVNAAFDAILTRDPRVFAIGEDVGKIGDVNQGFAGLQDKYGDLRVTDTGIRECTILGQGIGAAMRGLRPIAEIQYLDYLLYALQIMSDDLATMQYRSAGGQKAPLIVRTRGHRLEGIWHSGSPMGTIVHSLRGMHVCVPRNMTQAAGMYNTLLQGDEPALVIECLNGYRLKERMPNNIGSYQVELGVPEIIREGDDLTIVTYGSMCRIALDAAAILDTLGISVEIIDVQTLLPFDKYHVIKDSIKKTNRVLFADEDVPGGATSYMMQQVLEGQQVFGLLDSPPATIAAKAHRPAYGSDGDYFSKPSVDDLVDKVYTIMHETAPKLYPLYR